MSVTMNLVQSFYQELSYRRVASLTLDDLATLTGFKHDEIMRLFVRIEDVYKQVFEKIVLPAVIEGCLTVNDFIVNFVEYINDNRIFSMNMYYLTMLMNRRNYLIRMLNRIFRSYDEKEHCDIIANFIYKLTDWFDSDLNTNKEMILDDLLI